MFKHISIFALIAIFSTQLFSQDPLPLDPKVKYGKLKNGITYYVRENSKPENRAEIQILIKAGSLQEDEKQLGLAHFIEHMAFNGTKNFPGNEVIKYMESTGMRFGSDINASTSWERVYYTLQVPTDNAKMLDDGFQVLQDWMMNVTFDSEELEKERNVIIEEWRLRTQTAQAKVSMETFKALLKNSRYEERITIGDTAVILNAPREDFVRYYKDFYKPDISAVIAVGDFDADEIMAKIEKYFNQVPAVKEPTNIETYTIPDNATPITSVIADKELTSYTLDVIYRHPQLETKTREDYKELLKTQMINGMLNARYRELLQSGNAPYLQAYAARFSFPGHIQPFQVGLAPKPDDVEKGFRTTLAMAFSAKQHGFVDSEIERQKAEIISSYATSFNERETTPSRRYAQEYYQHFLEGTFAPGIEYEYTLTQELLKEITKEDLNKTVASYFRDDNIVITHNGPDKSKLLPEDKLLMIYNEMAAGSYDPYIDDAAGGELLATMPKSGKIIKSDQNEDVDIQMLEMSNGAKVILKNTDYSADEIVLRAYSPGGSSLASVADLPSAQVASTIVNSSGVSDFGPAQLNKMLAGKQVSASAFIGTMTEGMNASSTKADLETMFQLIHLYFTAPRVDDGAYSSYIERLTQNVIQSKNNPNSAFRDTVTNTINGYHERSVPWDESRVKMINKEKALAFYKERFADASDFTFILVGNLDDPKIKTYIETYLASLPSLNRNENFGNDIPDEVVKKENKSLNVGKENTATVMLYMNGENYDYNSLNNLKLDALVRVMNIFLLEEIREKRGGVYSIGGYEQTEKYPDADYSVTISYGCDPARVKELNGAIVDVIESLKSKPCGDDYLVRATETMKSEFKKALESNRAWASIIYQAMWNGSDINFVNEYVNYIDKITPNEIQTLAKKYLDTNNMKTFVRYPETFKN